MKHLLILLSFLLLSSPVIGDNHTLPVMGEKGETLYGWGKYPEIVWKGFGDKETHSKYEGDVENGKPNGVGILISPMGGKYVGSWKNGVRNGKGTTTYSSGTKYEGGWKDGGMWNGTLYDTNGKILHKIVNGEIQSP